MSGPDRLDGLLTAAAAATPERTALVDGAVRLRYGELEAGVGQLAAELDRSGIGAGSVVGVLLGKGHRAVTAIHAVLRTGGVVAPLAPTDPATRLARMAVGAGLDALVVDDGTTGRAVEVAAAVRAMGVGDPAGDPWPLGGGLSVVPLEAPRRWSASAGGYVLFTSGSTGWPKGVLLDHANVLHFVRWAVRELGIGPDDVLGSQAALTFDLSTLDIFGAMLAGARVSLLPEVLTAFPRDVVDWLAEQRVTTFYAVPTLYQRIVDAGGCAGTLPDLRLLPFAGEPYPVAALERLVGAFPDARIANLYGPTETNVCTWAEVPSTWRAGDGLAAGTPIDGLWVGLVDEEGSAVTDPGATGEVTVAGPAVFRGYLVDGALHDPTGPVHGGPARAYRTGDIGRIDGSGSLWLGGRRDHQVKVRGHRMDLSDIESAAGEVDGTGSCAAYVRSGTDGDVLVLAVAAAAGPLPDLEDALRTGLAARLPRRMLPDEIRVVAELPMTDRGKVDRAALAADQDDPATPSNRETDRRT